MVKTINAKINKKRIKLKKVVTKELRSDLNLFVILFSIFIISNLFFIFFFISFGELKLPTFLIVQIFVSLLLIAILQKKRVIRYVEVK